MVVNNNKYQGNINTYKAFEEGVKNKEIEVKGLKEGLKVTVRKGKLAERVVSRQISHERNSLIDCIKNLFLTIFSKNYREAKEVSKVYLKKFAYRYDRENAPYQNLYKYILGEELKKRDAPQNEPDRTQLKKEKRDYVYGLDIETAKKQEQEYKAKEQLAHAEALATKKKNKAEDKAKAAAKKAAETKPQVPNKTEEPNAPAVPNKTEEPNAPVVPNNVEPPKAPATPEEVKNPETKPEEKTQEKKGFFSNVFNKKPKETKAELQTQITALIEDLSKEQELLQSQQKIIDKVDKEVPQNDKELLNTQFQDTANRIKQKTAVLQKKMNQIKNAK